MISIRFFFVGKYRRKAPKRFCNHYFSAKNNSGLYFFSQVFKNFPDRTRDSPLREILANTPYLFLSSSLNFPYFLECQTATQRLLIRQTHIAPEKTEGRMKTI